MKYFLLLLVVACGGNNLNQSKPKSTPPIDTPPDDLRKVSDPFFNKKFVDWDQATVPSRACFAWDPNPDFVDGYRFYLSETPNQFGAEKLRGQATTNSICIEGLIQGRQYYATVSAFREDQESPYATQLAFRHAYIISRADLKLTVAESSDELGRKIVSFKGPESVMEANQGFVEWSDDLEDWQPLQVVWQYDNGVYSFVMPDLGERAFFRLGFGMGVRD